MKHELKMNTHGSEWKDRSSQQRGKYIYVEKGPNGDNRIERILYEKKKFNHSRGHALVLHYGFSLHFPGT